MFRRLLCQEIEEINCLLNVIILKQQVIKTSVIFFRCNLSENDARYRHSVSVPFSNKLKIF